MNILICDDKIADANRLSDLIKQIYPGMNITIFEDTDKLLDCVRQDTTINICFINTIMPKTDGMALSEELRNKGYNGHIVFCSTTKEYAYEAFCAGAFYYLIKPATKEMIEGLFKRLDDLYNQIDTSEIIIKTVKGFASIAFRDIAYIEVITHNVYFNLLSGKVLISNSALREIADLLLADKRFAYCHRSYIVNIDAILHICSNEITLKNNKAIPISRTYYTKLKKVFKKTADESYTVSDRAGFYSSKNSKTV